MARGLSATAPIQKMQGCRWTGSENSTGLRMCAWAHSEGASAWTGACTWSSMRTAATGSPWDARTTAFRRRAMNISGHGISEEEKIRIFAESLWGCTGFDSIDSER